MKLFHSAAVLFARTTKKVVKPKVLAEPPKLNLNTVKAVQVTQVPKSWKLPNQERVSFNLAKLSSLSGHDKINLFKDYLKTHSRLEAIHVYKKLVEIGLTNRLEYKDFHNLFRLLLQNPKLYRKVIVQIRDQIVNNGLVPTVYFDNEYLACLIKWNNIIAARQVLDELLRLEKKVDLHSYELFLEFYLKRKQYTDALEIVEKIKVGRPLTRPSMGIYLKIMDVYTGLGNAKECLQVYLDGEENLERLYVNHLEATSQADDERWKVDNRIQLFNAYINCLSTVDEYQKILEMYKDFKEEGWLVKSKSSANTFHIILKSIHAGLQDGTLTLEDDQLDKYWGDLVRICVLDYLHYARYMTLVRSIGVLDELYRNSSLTLNISIHGSKRQAIESAYLASIVDLDFERAIDEMNRVRKSQTRKPMRFVYYKFLRLARERGNEKVVQKWMEEDKIEDNGDGATTSTTT
jgi:tetratricopeptide (TPR) repeat protein